MDFNFAFSPFARTAQNLDCPHEFAWISHCPPATVADFTRAAPARRGDVAECVAARAAVVRPQRTQVAPSGGRHARSLSIVAG